MIDYKDTTALVTGAASGIGEALQPDCTLTIFPGGNSLTHVAAVVAVAAAVAH